MGNLIGVLGHLGKMGAFHTQALKDLGEVPFTADARQGPVDIPHMARVCEAVIIATPTPMHAEHAIEFLRRGKPVLIEKPIAMNVQDARLICAEGARNGTPIHVGYINRFIPALQRLREEFTSGRLEIHRSGPKPIGDYGGVAIDLGSHDVDLLHHLFGSDIAVVTGAQSYPDYYAAIISGYTVWGDLIAEYGTTSRHREWFIFPDDDSLDFLWLDLTKQTLRRTGQGGSQTLEDREVNQVHEQASAWLAAIRNDKPSVLCTGLEALKVLEDIALASPDAPVVESVST